MRVDMPKKEEKERECMSFPVYCPGYIYIVVFDNKKSKSVCKREREREGGVFIGI